MKTFLMLALLSSVATAPAMAESFTRDGVSYEYAVASKDGYQLVTGTNVSTGEAFRLRIQGDAVSGDYAGASVRFRTSGELAAKSGGASVFAAK
ncbi:hypothetical protein [Sphingomonas sp. SRS2]|uniref:hypothetical protein n=1 Tax=Sphingomonas sp. SRS2 TaxID=133190 RepID=UPI0006184429|nr:hypothetical protein [Sphingomonas sp. SRS2]KKC26619.1 hypothetical protein WP12_07665 [Sphingomonas sp. SRS2]